MDFKLPDEHAVILAQTLVTVWQSDNALDGHEIRRSLLLGILSLPRGPMSRRKNGLPPETEI